jgi:5-methyltetrahydrofolate--homocysteine methyltransferase
MTRNLYELLESQPYILGDGAMGTELQSAGLEPGGAPELWNVTHSGEVREILGGYVKAGSQIVTTNTFGGTAPRLELHALADQVEELARAGAQLARDVAGEQALVGGDIGPTGEILFPLGVLEPEEAAVLFAAQVRGLVAGGADFLLIETMSDLAEVEAAVRGCQEAAPGMPIAVTMSFDTNLHTMMGVSPAEAVTRIAEMGVRAIGANCGRGPDEMEQIIQQMAAARPEGVFLIAQSNAGLPRPVGDQFQYDGTPEVMARYAVRMRELGVNVIGGCCGTTATHIAAMRAALSA